MENKLEKQLHELKTIDRYRKYWLILSFFVTAVLTGLIFGWNSIHDHKIVWALATLGLSTAVVWWYWTMSIIRRLINHRVEESKLLHDLVMDIRCIKDSVQKSLDNDLDKSK